MKLYQIIRITIAFLIIFPVSACAYKYTGEGDYVELTRTYIPGIAQTKGFMLELPVFETTKNFTKEYKIGKLPKQDDVIFIDLVTNAYKALSPPQKQKNDLKTIPKNHRIKFELIDIKTEKIIACGESSISELRATKNRNLLRPFILNIKKIEANTISKEADLKLKFQYLINETPLPREMIIVITKRAPTA